MERKRHVIVYWILMLFIPLFVRWKFNYKYPDLRKIEGPYLVLVNHNIELDPLLVATPFGGRRHMYFVASEHIMRKGFATKLMMYFIKPIIRLKGRSDARTVAEILRTLRRGESVCIFAEGNRSFDGVTGDIPKATGKMARKAGVKVITYRIEGGYFTQPRWSTTLRKGLMNGVLVHEYTPEEVAVMTDEEFGRAIERDLYEDAYATQARVRIPFKGKDLALGMESTIFTCPSCGQIGTLKSDAHGIWCMCGYTLDYTEYGELVDEDGRVYSITELHKLQIEELKSLVREMRELHADDEEFPYGRKEFFSDEVILYDIDKNHEILTTEKGVLAAYADRLECCDRVIYYRDMQGISIYSRNSIVLNTVSDEKHYEIKSDIAFCALKYLVLYQIMNGEL